jgi:hypothetical protein
MAKKNFDDFLGEVEKPKRLTAEDAARMVSLVHEQAIVPPTPPPSVVVEKSTNIAAKPKLAAKITSQKAVLPPTERNPRGRPRAAREETERLYRLSVDLPGSVLLKLKAKAMASETDMKTYVRELLEKHLPN